jgi:hypothetical protein
VFVGAKCEDYLLDLLFALGVAFVPAAKIYCQPLAHHGGSAAFPSAEQITVKVKRNECEDFSFRCFLSACSFSRALSISASTHPLLSEFFEQQSSTLSHKRIPRSTWSRMSSPPTQLLFIQPAPNTLPRQTIVQPPREGFIFVAVAYEAGIELDRLIEQRWQVFDERVRKTAAPKKR